jgi:tetratricopeptide (TPR) repeat protein
MSAILNGNEPDDVFLDNFEAEIAEVRKTGVCSDVHLLERNALKLRGLNVDLSRQRKAILDSGICLYVVGHSSLALDILLKSRPLFHEGAEQFEKYSFSSLLGVCAADTNDLALAMQAYGDALTLSEHANDSEWSGKIWSNLGGALAYSGLYREANSAWMKAIKHFSEESESAKHLIAAYTNIAVTHLFLDEPKLGITAIKLAEKYIDFMPNDAHFNQQRILLEVCTFKLLIEIGDIENARKHVANARRLADSTGTPRADVSATVAGALLEVYSGAAQSGIPKLIQVIEKASALKIATTFHRASLVKALEYLGRHEEALEQLQKMANLQRTALEANILRQVERHLEQLHASTDHAPIEDPKKAINRDCPLAQSMRS